MSNGPPKPMLRRNHSLRKGSVTTVLKARMHSSVAARGLERVRGPEPVLAVAALGLERNRTAWVRGANSSCLSLTPTDWTSGGRSSPPRCLCLFPLLAGGEFFPRQAP